MFHVIGSTMHRLFCTSYLLSGLCPSPLCDTPLSPPSSPRAGRLEVSAPHPHRDGLPERASTLPWTTTRTEVSPAPRPGSHPGLPLLVLLLLLRRPSNLRPHFAVIKSKSSCALLSWNPHVPHELY